MAMSNERQIQFLQLRIWGWEILGKPKVSYLPQYQIQRTFGEMICHKAKSNVCKICIIHGGENEFWVQAQKGLILWEGCLLLTIKWWRWIWKLGNNLIFRCWKLIENSTTTRIHFNSSSFQLLIFLFHSVHLSRFTFCITGCNNTAVCNISLNLCHCLPSACF